MEVVSEENFRMLSDRLQDEQKKLRDELAAIKNRSEEFEKTEENIQSFVTLIKSMQHVDELDRQIVQALIERIEIGEKASPMPMVCGISRLIFSTSLSVRWTFEL